MEKAFKVKVNEEMDFKLTSEDVKNLDIIPSGSNSFHFIYQHQSINVRVTYQDRDHRYFEMEIGGDKYRIKIETALDQLVEEMGLSVGNSTSINQVNAPMPGLILEVMVHEGQEVKQGDPLLVLEAMKMENTIVAPRQGIVKNLLVEAGQTADKNQLLLELE